MSKAATLIFIGTLLTIASSSVHAFDGSRSGFQIGLGIGAHVSEINYKNDFASSTIESEKKPAVSLSLGYGFSNRIVGFVGGKGGAILIGDREASFAISGVGGSVYFSEQAPSLYVTGLVGASSLSFNENKDELNDEGSGWLVGVGYEVVDRLHLELSYANADLEHSENNNEETSDISATFLTVQYNWY